MADTTGKGAGGPIKVNRPAVKRVRGGGKPVTPRPPLADAATPADDATPPVFVMPESPSAPLPTVTSPGTAIAAPAPAASDATEAAPAASSPTEEVDMNETVTAFAEKAQQQTRTAFANVGEQARTAVEKTRKVAEDVAEFGKGNVEAMVESARIAAQGFETMGQEAATFARARYDHTASMFQTIASVKSPTELMQIQSDYVRAAFDALVKEASRSTEATMKLAGDVARPLQNRLAVAGDKIRHAA